jgi:membrane protein implicated in regulation of membrane protease activity
MEWWIWILLGLLLLLAELLTPGGFYIIFFGVGAVVVGVLAGFNVAGPLWFQVILFSVLSVIAL